jgi:hypothetical protein
LDITIKIVVLIYLYFYVLSIDILMIFFWKELAVRYRVVSSNIIAHSDFLYYTYKIRRSARNFH